MEEPFPLKISNDDSVLFFIRLEAVFLMKTISSQKQNFACIVSALPQEIATYLQDLLLNPPKTNPDDKSKEELIPQTPLSERKRLQQLLETEILGDRKPSQLLHRLQTLSSNMLNDNVLQHIFEGKLSHMVLVSLTAI